MVPAQHLNEVLETYLMHDMEYTLKKDRYIKCLYAFSQKNLPKFPMVDYEELRKIVQLRFPISWCTRFVKVETRQLS